MTDLLAEQAARLFPKSPAFSEANRPARVECDIYDLEIEGTVPVNMRGTWCRLGPDTQYPPFIEDDIFINGDGFVTAFHFENGHVDLKSRYVRTERFLAERQARRALFGRYRNAFTDEPRVAGMSRSSANTTPIWHGGRLLCLKEDGRPVELDPRTLETKGEFSWGGKLRSKTVTAHPKIDPHTGELIFFGYEADGDFSSDIAYCVADKNGQLVREEWFRPPYVSMMHDFAVTKDFVIFPVFPTTTDADRLRAGGSHWAFDESRETLIGIMPRNGSARDLRWFRRPSCFAYHIINAYNTGGTIYLDLALSQRNGFPFIPNVDGSPVDLRKTTPFPTRWTFDMNGSSDAFEESALSSPGELPRVDDRLVANDYRYSWLLTFSPPDKPGQRAAANLGRLDVKDRKLESWRDPAGGSFQEPQFVAKDSAVETGYLLSVVDYPSEGRGELQIFDAERLGDGPMARVHIPLHFRSSIHTTWIPEDNA